MAGSNEISRLFIPTDRSFDVAVNIYEKDKEHARSHTFIRSVLIDGVEHFHMAVVGSGNYGQYQNVLWEKEAVFKEEKNTIKTLNSSMTVKNQQGEVIAKYGKKYQYEQGVVTFEKIDKKSNKQIRKEFPIKGPICDDITMIQFLKNYAAHVGNNDFKRFYLITNEPRLYHVVVKEVTEKIPSLSAGGNPTIKLQLMADLGVLTELADKIVPSTYVWYERKKPYRWHRYVGLESGQRSEYVSAVMINDKNNFK